MSTRRGRLVVFEGIDGAGKSTTLRNVASSLAAGTTEVVCSREPTDGPWGQRIRASARVGRPSPEVELDWFLRDREQHAAEVISPALERGAWVLLDRYYLSTVAYQGARGLDPKELLERHRHLPKPDLVLLFDLPVFEAMTRLRGREGGPDAFEREKDLQRIRANFLAIDRKLGGPVEVVKIIRADEPEGQVFLACMREVVRVRGWDFR